MRHLRVHFLPSLVAPRELSGRSCVVIDVLRATTTIVTALASGARAVLPCLTVEEARQRAKALGRDQSVLGGERGGLAIEGFLLGNSPSEYAPARVAGKTVVLTTTNGTKALLHCAAAVETLVAAFVNLTTVCVCLAERKKIDLVCAGTDGQITREDVLLAGAIAARLGDNADWQFNDEAQLARDAWRCLDAEGAPRRLVEALEASQGGQNLVTIGMHADIALAAEVDHFAIVPRFDATTGTIEIARKQGSGR